MMNFEQACAAFNVAPTPRQRRRWNAKSGRAFRLASYFSSIIDARKVCNGEVSDCLAREESELADAKSALAKAKKAKKATKPLKKNIEMLTRRIENLRKDIIPNIIPDAGEIQNYLNTFSRTKMAS